MASMQTEILGQIEEWESQLIEVEDKDPEKATLIRQRLEQVSR